MDAKELFQRYTNGERDFSGVDLSEITINPFDLGQIWIEFSEVNFSGANLRKISLIGEVYLTNANLTNADLREANLQWVTFWDLCDRQSFQHQP